MEEYIITKILARRVEKFRLLLHKHNTKLVPNIIRKYNFRSKRCLASNEYLPSESRMQRAKPPAQNPTQVITAVIEEVQV
jgi:hypothetical protein